MKRSARLQTNPFTLALAGCLAVTAVACGGEDESISSFEDALTSQDITGQWVFTADPAGAVIRFDGCSTTEGCVMGEWTEVQAALGEVCVKTDGKVCIELSDFAPEAQGAIAVDSKYGATLLFAHPDGASVSLRGLTTPRQDSALFGRGNIMGTGSTYDPHAAAITSASLVQLTFEPSLDGASGAAYISFAAGLISNGAGAVGIATLAVPVSASRL